MYLYIPCYDHVLRGMSTNSTAIELGDQSLKETPEVSTKKTRVRLITVSVFVSVCLLAILVYVYWPTSQKGSSYTLNDRALQSSPGQEVEDRLNFFEQDLPAAPVDFIFQGNQETLPIESPAFRIVYHATQGHCKRDRGSHSKYPLMKFISSLVPGQGKVDLAAFMKDLKSSNTSLHDVIGRALKLLGLRHISVSLNTIPPDPDFKNEHFVSAYAEDHQRLLEVNNARERFSETIPKFKPIVIASSWGTQRAPSERFYVVYLLMADGTWAAFDFLTRSMDKDLSTEEVMKIVPDFVLYANTEV